MEARRHLGGIATPLETGVEVEVDASLLAGRLLLFDECVLESIRLKEIPALVAVFGAAGLLELIDEGALRVVCDAMTTGQVGQTNLEITERRGSFLPLGSFRLTPVVASPEHRKEYLHGVLQEVHGTQLSPKEQIRLKKALADRVEAYPHEAGEAAVAQATRDIRARDPIIGLAIRRVFAREERIETGDVWVETSELGFEGDYRVAIRTEHPVEVAAQLEHKIVERGLLEVAGLNQRFELMRSFHATTGFRDDEAALFEGRVRGLVARIDPSLPEAQLRRVIAIADARPLRDLAPGVRADRLLRLREGDGIREFRTWLSMITNESDAEIAERLEAVRPLVASALQGGLGRFLRFIVTAGAGLHPSVGPIAATALSAFDQFVLDRLAGKPGPAAFLGREYPAIFEPPPQGHRT